MRVYQVAREFYPYANAGGLKEVVTGVSVALEKLSVDSVVFIPRYGFIDIEELELITTFTVSTSKISREITAYKSEYSGVKVYMLDFPEVRDKYDVYTYTEQDTLSDPAKKRGEGFKDSSLINSLFQLSVLEFIRSFLDKPDVLLLHDGHTGLIPLLIEKSEVLSHYFRDTKRFFIIHNAGLAYHQRVFAPILRELGMIDEDDMCEVCNEGYVDPLASAVLHSSVLTVSPYYAEEILDLKHEFSSGGFGEFCKRHSVAITGITNGVNIEHFKSIGVTGKPTLKEKFQFRTNLFKDFNSLSSLKLWGCIDSYSNRPLFVFQNRITEQKGIDTLISSVSAFLDGGGSSMFVVMGQGEKRYEEALVELAKRYHGSVCYIQGYNEGVAKRLFLSSDYFILTSRWEPCGLTDFEAQLAGSIPIVHSTGGLKKVINNETGYRYKSDEELLSLLFMCENSLKDGREVHNRMTETAYKYIQMYYTWDKVVELNYIPLFENNNE